MVNISEAEPSAPETILALSYAPAAARPGLAALFALDERLGGIAHGAREPMVGQMRLTWWHEALSGLARPPVPAEPLLRALAAHALPAGTPPAALASLVEGWEVLLDEGGDTAAAAAARGRALFEMAARLLGAEDRRVGAAGAAWVMAERWPEEARAETLDLFAARWPRALRPLGALAAAVRAGAGGRYPPGHPRRVLRMAAHRLTGR